MPKKHTHIKRYLILICIVLGIVDLLIIGKFYQKDFNELANIVKVLWAGIGAVFSLFGIGSILKDSLVGKKTNARKLLEIPEIQIVVVLLFVSLLVLTGYLYQQKRLNTRYFTIAIERKTGNNEQIKIRRTFTEASDSVKGAMDEILIPQKFNGRKKGVYTFEVLDTLNLRPFSSGDVPSPAPGCTSKVIVNDISNTAKLFINSDPPGADIIIDESKEGVTPDTVRNLNHSAHQIRLKKTRYHDTLIKADLSGRNEINLPTVILNKKAVTITECKVVVKCRYYGTRYRVNDQDPWYFDENKVMYLRPGNYQFSYFLEGGVKSGLLNVKVTGATTVTIPPSEIN